MSAIGRQAAKAAKRAAEGGGSDAGDGESPERFDERNDDSSVASPEPAKAKDDGKSTTEGAKEKTQSVEEVEAKPDDEPEFALDIMALGGGGGGGMSADDREEIYKAIGKVADQVKKVTADQRAFDNKVNSAVKAADEFKVEIVGQKELQKTTAE